MNTHTKETILILLSVILINQTANAQIAPAFFVESQSILPKSSHDFVNPSVYSAWDFDEDAFMYKANNVPHESVVSPQFSDFTLDFPMPDGNTETFKVVEYSMFEEGLATAFPNIKTYRGVSDKDPNSTIYFDLTDFGLRAVMRTSEGMIYIDPAQKGNSNYHIVYNKKDLPNKANQHSCHFDEVVSEEELENILNNEPIAKAGDCALRTYRLAVAATGEYSNFHGAFSSSQQSTVLSAVTTTINRVNEVFENEIGVRLILVSNTQNVFYYNGGNDPYTNNSAVSLLPENQLNIDNVIGSANYDVGHVFATSAGGVATLNSPCNSSTKARGATGLPSPVGDTYDVDFVCHELGHQFGARHTFNNSCSGNRSDQTAYEPGSGSTIMGYGGTCSPLVQGGSDPYFHAVSLGEMTAFTNVGGGSNCSGLISTGNNAPVADAGEDFIIPRSTPFILKGSATDADNDPLTYCWEQMNNEITTQPPVNYSSSGPNFRSRLPNATGERYFPRLDDLATGTNPQWEVLSNVSRSLDFRMTVRDNSASGGGCTHEDNMQVHVVSNAGPFTVNNPGNGWSEGSTQTVTWNVANTNNFPVNCAKVDILLSYDGGYTYPVVLAKDVNNDGMASVVVPAGTTNAGRVMVKSSDNIFFNVSSSNFNIASGINGFYVSVINPEQTFCRGTDAEYQIEVGATGNFNQSVFLSVSNSPSGLAPVFSQNPVPAGSTVTLTFPNTQNTAEGNYTPAVNGSVSGSMKTVPIFLGLDPMPNSPITTSPSNNADGQALTPTFTWNAVSNINEYEIQVATNPSFTGNVIREFTTSVSHTLNTELVSAQDYFWRVRANADCGSGNWSTPLRFSTLFCKNYTQDMDEPILQGNPTANTFSYLNIEDEGTVLSLEVIQVQGTHSWVEDLSAFLIAPNNESVQLWSNTCGSTNDFNIGFSSNASTSVSSVPCSPLGLGNMYTPVGNLDNFVNNQVGGLWALRLNDNFSGDGGDLQSWTLKICLSDYVNTNQPLPIELAEFRAIPNADDISLVWNTLSEADNTGFEVQRRVEGEEEFATIGFQVGENRPANYAFLDEDVRRGVVYQYRLRQIDSSGREEYSPVRQAILELNRSEINIFPNPTSEYIMVESEQSGTLDIYNAAGVKVYTSNLETQTNKLNISHLAAGMYSVDIHTKQKTEQQKLVIR